MSKRDCAGTGGFYGFGVIGSLFYFLPNAATFSAVIVGIIKSLFWPAVIIYELLEILNK
jgi:hypothetical protein